MSIFKLFLFQFCLDFPSVFSFFQVLEQRFLSKTQPALPPPQPVKEVVSLAVEEAPLDMSKEQSHTLMIEGVLDQLTLEVKTTEAQSKMEEEDSSSTPGKKDIEDDSVTNENQFINVPSQQIEIQHEERDKQESTEVEESALERGLEEETVPMTENEV